MVDPGKTVFVHSYFRHTRHGLTLVHSYWRHAPGVVLALFGAGAVCHKHGRKPGHHALGLILAIIGLSVLSYWIWGFLAKAIVSLAQGIWQDFMSLHPVVRWLLCISIGAGLYFLGRLVYSHYHDNQPDWNR